MRCKMMIPALAMGMMIAASIQVHSQTLGLEQVIREVCSNSDSVKMMKESVIKADQMVRENWANALPYISATGAYIHNYGSAFGSSGGSSGSSRPLAKEASTFTPQDSAFMGYIASMLKSLQRHFQPGSFKHLYRRNLIQPADLHVREGRNGNQRCEKLQ